MLHSRQLSGSPIASHDRSLDARVRLLVLTAGALIALVATIALGTGLAAGGQAVPWIAAAVVAVVLASISAVALVAALGRSTARSVSGSFAHTADLLDRVACGDFALSVPTSADRVQEEAHQSIRRLTRTLRRHAEDAEALAEGAYRRVATRGAAEDPIGIALGRVAGYMDELATAAQRVARGDLTAPAEVPAPTDTLGQANAAMARQIVSVVQEVAAMKRSIAAAAEAMQSDAEELVSGTRLDSEQLRRAADRVSQITLQAHATATRATTLEHRSLDGAAIVRQGASAVHGSIDALREVCRKSAIVQELARNAGLVAVGAVSQASAAESAQQGVGAVEDEVRRLAAQAVEVSSELHRLSQAGVGAADESHLILERMGDSIHEGRSLVRELTATSRSHAAELLVIDEAVSEAHQLARRNAATARKLAGQVDSLASHSRRLDALLRRFHRGRVAATTSRVREPSGPVLYRSPASAFTPTPARRPRLAVIGK